MKKKTIKKEKNPLLKNLNTEKMNSSQIQEEITKNDKLMKDFISKGKYPEADECNSKIESLKKLFKQKKSKEIIKRHFTEKENLLQNKNSDIENLNYLWEKKFEELQMKSQSALDELKKNQEEELQQLYAQYQESINDVKPSSNYLKLKKEEEGLVKLRKFREADIVRKRKEAQMKIDYDKNGKIKENTLKNFEKKLKQKHINELLYLQNKFRAEFDSLSNAKQKDIEFLNKKYSVKNKDLIKQQKREDTINKFNNYGRRIANLHNNYEEKFIIGKKEYSSEPQIPKVDRIYAEIKNNNNIEGGSFLKNEKQNENNIPYNEEESKEIEDNNNNDNKENIDNGANQPLEKENENENENIEKKSDDNEEQKSVNEEENQNENNSKNNGESSENENENHEK